MTFDQALGKLAAHKEDNNIPGELPFISRKESKSNDSKDVWLLFDTNGIKVAIVDNHGVYGL
mgnify:FL=1